MKHGSLRVPIPQETRDILDADPLMHRCLIGHDCDGRIEWNHAIAYAGKRISDWWAITPLCTKHHREEARHRDKIKAFILSRVSMAAIQEKYPRIIL